MAHRQLIVEAGKDSVTVRRANGGPSVTYSLKEWEDIKAGKYDPPKKEKHPPQS